MSDIATEPVIKNFETTITAFKKAPYKGPPVRAVIEPDKTYCQPEQVLTAPNPKTLTGQLKVPMLSVIPPAALVYLGAAMRYGAFEAPKTDGSKGYGPYNWRDQPIEVMTYIDAAMRHLAQWTDGEETADDSGVHHLAHAMATIGILVDAIEHGRVIDNRPAVRSGVASRLLSQFKKSVTK